MKTKKKKYHKEKLPAKYLFVLLGICFASVLITYYTLRTEIIASSCMTLQQVQADTRCLYIYQNNVYLPPSTPHHGHNCRTDVGNSVPSSHSDGRLLQSSPYYIAAICPASITATPTPTPTSPVATPTATSTPISNPTTTPNPTTSVVNPTSKPIDKPTNAVPTKSTSAPCKQNTGIGMGEYDPESGQINCSKNPGTSSTPKKNSNKTTKDGNDSSNNKNQPKSGSIVDDIVNNIKHFFNLK